MREKIVSAISHFIVIIVFALIMSVGGRVLFGYFPDGYVFMIFMLIGATLIDIRELQNKVNGGK